MSSIISEMRLPASAPESRAARPARLALPGHPHDSGAHGEGTGAAPVNASAQAESAPVTGKVYALKDGSGYVALGSDGHYYKLEPAGSGLAYASASGPVDTALVDVTHGPVRTMRHVPTTGASRSSAQPTGAHPPGAAAHDDTASGADSTGMSPASAGQRKPVATHATAEAALGTSAGTDPKGTLPEAATLPVTQGSLAPDTEDAATAARAAHHLIAGHPDAAIRSHVRVSPRSVVSLLR